MLPQKSVMALSEYIQYKKYHKRWRKKDLAILEAFVEGGGDMPYDHTVAAAAPRGGAAKRQLAEPTRRAQSGGTTGDSLG